MFAVLSTYVCSSLHLLNQPQNKIVDAIHSFFNNCSPGDLVLFYFSGHGVKDEKGNLYIATPTTRLDQNNKVLPHTAISASFIKEQMTDSSSRQQVVILDCCFSGAFARGLTLGNKSWAVLTSSDIAEYSYAPEPSELSIYTRYLVEGIKTGVGDLNNDGNISVDELYEYTKKKVKEISPKMNPLLDNGRAGFKIILAKSLQDDPKLKYRKEAERIASQEEKNFTSLNEIYEGSITVNSNRTFLDVLQKSLNLTNEDAKAIETEVLAPYRLRKDKLNNYGKVFTEAIKHSNPPSQDNRQNLKVLQQVLNLRDEDVESIEKRILDLPNSRITKQQSEATHGGTIQVSQSQIYHPAQGSNEYTKLDNLLAEKKWKEADKETALIMLNKASKQSSGFLSEDDIKKLPKKVLSEIDKLWNKHSKGRFGFSVQRRIYLQANKNYDKLGNRLGWKKQRGWLNWRELDFSEQAPEGHLPSGTCPLGNVEGLIWDGCNVVSVLLSRSDWSS